MLATLLADPIAGLVDSAYLARTGSVALAGVGVALSVFNTAAKLLTAPLLAVTTSAVAQAVGRQEAAAAAAAWKGGGGGGAAAAAAAAATTAAAAAAALAGTAAGSGRLAKEEAHNSGGDGASADATGGKEGKASRASTSYPESDRSATTGSSCDTSTSTSPSSVHVGRLISVGSCSTAAGHGDGDGGGEVASNNAPPPPRFPPPPPCPPLLPCHTVRTGTPSTSAPAAAAAATPTTATAVAPAAAAAASFPDEGGDDAAAAADAEANTVPRAVAACVFLAALLGSLLAGAMQAAAAWLVELWGVPPASPLYDPALGFLRVRAAGAPVTIVLLTLQGVFRGLQDTRTPFAATLLSSALNVALAPLLIFGARLGAAGAAAATVASQAITTGMLTRQLMRRLALLQLPPPPPLPPPPLPPPLSSPSPLSPPPLPPPPPPPPPHQHQHQLGPLQTQKLFQHQGRGLERAGGGGCEERQHQQQQQQQQQQYRTTRQQSGGGKLAQWGARCSWLAAVSDLLPLFKPTGLLVLRGASVMTVYAVATSVAARAGPEASAGHQLCFQVWLACSLLADALSVAAHSLMARDLGAGAVAGARQVAARVGELSLGLGLALAAGLALGGRALLGLFTADPEVVQLMTALVPIMAATQPAAVLAMAWDGILYGVGGFRYAAVAMALAALPAIAVMRMAGGLYGRVLGGGGGGATSDAAVEAAMAVAAGDSTTAAAMPTGPGPTAAAAAVAARIAALLAGDVRLGLVWSGLGVLMVVRWLAIAVPYIARWGPFRRLRDDAGGGGRLGGSHVARTGSCEV
ncbi:hypothetical protein PLESTF_000516800 [Pleodorina starrii]|nr:hypothetical protein PLESTF_000516800 [Pleodorina starrii]